MKKEAILMEREAELCGAAKNNTVIMTIMKDFGEDVTTV